MELDISFFGHLGDYLISIRRETAVFRVPKNTSIAEEIALMFKHEIFRSFHLKYSFDDENTYIAHFDL